MTVLVTGGAGFIGSNFVHEWLSETNERVITYDKLTYAGNIASLGAAMDDPRHDFVHGDLLDQERLEAILDRYSPDYIVHFAAESHVDRSIHGPELFVSTNVMGTLRLLDAARSYFDRMSPRAKDKFRLVNVSTDEVFGSLQPDDAPFTEISPYRPSSPYSASKAAADHLAHSYHVTFGLPVITTHCSNNYGPFQFPEKLIPLMILNGIRGIDLPVYGDGMNVRDWLFVSDHCAAIRQVLRQGKAGESYNIGGNCERTNLEIVGAICDLLDERIGAIPGGSRRERIRFVEDRPGHDRRYAIDSAKIRRDCGWLPAESFESGLAKTVNWYLENGNWIAGVESGEYRDWIDKHYGNRKRQA